MASRLVPNPTLYAQVKQSYFNLFKQNPLMSLFVRFAFHDAGTFDKVSKTGGPNASIRFKKELDHDQNGGLGFAIPFIQEKQKEFPQVSFADLIQASSISAIEFAGGPVIPFRFGRADAQTDAECTPSDRLPLPSNSLSELRAIFNRMGFGDLELVVLSGAHTIGRAHPDISNTNGPWTTNPNVFDNSYFIELLQKKPKAGLIRFASDKNLLNDAGTKALVQRFAASKDEFFSEYSKAQQKLSELGVN